MPTAKPLPKSKRNELTAIALDLYKGGWSERAALEDVIAGKQISDEDREAIERELAAAIERWRPDGQLPLDEPGPLAIVDPVSEETPSRFEGEPPFDQSPGYDAEQRHISTSHASVDNDGRITGHPDPRERPKRPKRRTIAERLIEAQVAAARAELEVEKLRLLLVAEFLRTDGRSKHAARMIVASVHAGFVAEALPYARKGMSALGFHGELEKLTASTMLEVLAAGPDSAEGERFRDV